MLRRPIADLSDRWCISKRIVRRLLHLQHNDPCVVMACARRNGPQVLLNEPLFTTQYAAVRIGVSISTLLRWTRDERIPYMKFGPRLIRFTQADVATAVAVFKVAQERKGAA